MTPMRFGLAGDRQNHEFDIIFIRYLTLDGSIDMAGDTDRHVGVFCLAASMSITCLALR